MEFNFLENKAYEINEFYLTFHILVYKVTLLIVLPPLFGLKRAKYTYSRKLATLIFFKTEPQTGNLSSFYPYNFFTKNNQLLRCISRLKAPYTPIVQFVIIVSREQPARTVSFSSCVPRPVTREFRVEIR